MDQSAAIIMTKKKSAGVSVILTLLFGGLGLFYSSIIGGILMTIVEVITFGVALVTFGFGVVLFPIVHLVCIAWGIFSVNSYNNKLIRTVSQSNM